MNASENLPLHLLRPTGPGTPRMIDGLSSLLDP